MVDSSITLNDNCLPKRLHSAAWIRIIGVIILCDSDRRGGNEGELS